MVTAIYCGRGCGIKVDPAKVGTQQKFITSSDSLLQHSVNICRVMFINLERMPCQTVQHSLHKND